MPPVYTVAHSEERIPFHVATTSSSDNSIAKIQRASSISPAKSKSRNQSQPDPEHPAPSPNGLDSSAYHPLTSANLPRRPSTDGVENLNRWSRSTSSSRDRRLSLGESGTFTFGTTEEKVSAKRLQMNLSSTGSPPSRPQETSRPLASAADPVLPILTLQTSANDSSSPSTASPSTAGLLSAAVRSTVPEYFSAWESTPRDFSQRRSPSQSRSANVGPSPSPISGSSNRVKRSNEGEEASKSRGHSRNRSQAGKSSAGSARTSKQPSQKAMLSKALQKANTAVLLDNAQNFEGAIQAYSEACALLQQVMLRSSGDEDRRKLEAIRNTYTSRISELGKIAPHLRDDHKALPARPEGEDYRDGAESPDDDEQEAAIIETATVTRIVNDQSYIPEHQQSRSIPSSHMPRRRESLLPSALDSMQYRSRVTQEPFTERPYTKIPMRERVTETSLNLAPPMESQYMPPPLSPMRLQSPMTRGTLSNVNNRQPGSFPPRGHTRAPSNESMSWLDTIDESGGSSASSVHSRTSSLGVRRKHIRAASGATEAEFDAALDAAVEAAYNEGFEPEDTPEPSHYDYDNDDEIVANVRRRVELAKERVRQTEREAAIYDARERERKRLLQQELERQDTVDDEFNGNESEEEERMLEEMTRGYVMDDFEFGLSSKSALPRESDSSGFSGRTWHSSIGSNPTTAGTTLSTVTEAATMAQLLANQSNTPPPSQGLPPPPSRGLQTPLPASASQGVRSRRLSGQNAKLLKIETATTNLDMGQVAPPTQPPPMPPPQVPIDDNSVQPKTAGLPQHRPTLSGTAGRPLIPQSARHPSSLFPGPSPSEILSPPTPTLTQTFTNDSETNGQTSRAGSPGRAQSRTGLRKNFSSSSLKNMKSRKLSLSNVDDGSDVSPNTPISSSFNSRDLSARLPAMPTLPTPIALAFTEKMDGGPTGGLYLFNNDISSPDSPGSLDPLNSGAPIPLEPCPTEYLLRPFWLMRALYQTIAHPRGGYLSTKLFVPRDVWKVKGVKIKNVEDKISNCDFLTAALLKLAQVDTFDADAVLEEMQSLEGVLEHVQTMLTKKLGNEVGVQSSGGMFKDAPTVGEVETGSISKTGSMSSKSSSFSWRRLRSKNSGIGLANSYSNKPTAADGPKEGLTMGTLPMTTTALSKVRFAKRDVSQLEFSGPNSNYMGALARLFDAAQTLDQIARQVEDPGLRHADKTQVGLELCTRHAAEFFGFYICRFVLTDIGMLLDKFIKRGSEWVLV